LEFQIFEASEVESSSSSSIMPTSSLMPKQPLGSSLIATFLGESVEKLWNLFSLNLEIKLVLKVVKIESLILWPLTKIFLNCIDRCNPSYPNTFVRKVFKWKFGKNLEIQFNGWNLGRLTVNIIRHY
jgi:hypothetical protein